MRFKIAILLAVLAIPGTATADTRDDVLNGAERCAGIADNRVWLDCFYGSAQPMRSLLGLSPAPQAHLVPPPGAAYTAVGGVPPRQRQMAYAPPPKEKGFWGDLLGSTKSRVENMPMAKYSFDRSGRFTVTLRDGQVWRQVESDIDRADWKKPAASYVVTVETATQNSFILKVKGERGLYHVKQPG